jgi:hypothetical protein
LFWLFLVAAGQLATPDFREAQKLFHLLFARGPFLPYSGSTPWNSQSRQEGP